VVTRMTRRIAAGFFAALLISACAGKSPAATTPAPSLSEGQWTGTVTHRWNESVTQSGVGTKTVTTQTYEAVIQVSSTYADIGSWTLGGQATITSTFTNDVESHSSTSLGPCNTHYTDDASGGGSVTVDGSLEAREGFYQFSVSIPGLDGSNDTVRDDSGCFGPKNVETVTWSIAPDRVGGSGDFTDPSHISGSTSEPREGGENTLKWDFTLSP
jgi:hypothetical protein